MKDILFDFFEHIFECTMATLDSGVIKIIDKFNGWKFNL